MIELGKLGAQVTKDPQPTCMLANQGELVLLFDAAFYPSI